MELDGSEFEKKIYVKKDAAPLLRMIFRASIPMRRRGRAAKSRITSRLGRRPILINPLSGNTGDARVSGGIGEARSLSISIITNRIRLCAIRCADEDCGAVLVTDRYHGDDDAAEAGAIAGATRARPDLRIAAVKELHEAGLAVGVSHRRWCRGLRMEKASSKQSRPQRKSGRAVVFLGSAVFDAVIGETVPAVRA